MGRISIAVLVSVFLALGCAGESSDGPSPTSTFTPNTPELPTQTAQPQPTATPQATVTLRAPQTPASPCPIADESFCSFATDIEHAMAIGDTPFIVANFIESDSVCPNIDGRCVGEPDGTIVDGGYVVAPDYKTTDVFKSAEELRATLGAIAQVDEEATDEYGDGTWTLYAVLANDGRVISLVTTTIGPDPIIADPTSARRVFTLRASRESGEWTIFGLQTFQDGDYLLRGYHRNGAIDSWLRWGKE